MKKFKIRMLKYADKIDKRWKSFPVRKQHRCIIFLFVLYLLLLTLTVFRSGKAKSKILIEHIGPPKILYDSSKNLSKP